MKLKFTELKAILLAHRSQFRIELRRQPPEMIPDVEATLNCICGFPFQKPEEYATHLADVILAEEEKRCDCKKSTAV